MGYHLGFVWYPHPHIFSLCIDAPKGPSYYPQNFMLQFYTCNHKNYYGTWMLLEKLCYMKTNINFRDQAWNRPHPYSPPSQSVWTRTLFYPISIMPKTFIEDSDNLKQPKNVKSIDNTTVSHLVSCYIITRPATTKAWEKELFWEISALGNLKLIPVMT